MTRAFVEELAGDAEHAAARGEMSAIYKINKQLSDKNTIQSAPSKTRIAIISLLSRSKQSDGYNTF